MLPIDLMVDLLMQEADGSRLDRWRVRHVSFGMLEAVSHDGLRTKVREYLLSLVLQPKPSDPVPSTRPEPTVGQVWRTHRGRLFVIHPGVLNRGLYSKCFEDGSHHGMYLSLSECVETSDVYIGQFAGFKVKAGTISHNSAKQT